MPQTRGLHIHCFPMVKKGLNKFEDFFPLEAVARGWTCKKAFREREKMDLMDRVRTVRDNSRKGDS